MTTDVIRKRYKFDLAALQRLAAINYAALRPMIAGVKQSGSKIIKVGQQLRFAVTVLETAPYTTEVRIEQQALLKQLPGLRETQIDVRLYHDAQLAEVVRSQGVSRLQASYEVPNPSMHHADEKHQVNHFLQEWLQLIRANGYFQEV
ncbi:DUF1249 domain-containing protein [Pseudidiomarina andamanensis]|uniref:DUF1249 domain-containing protein n=1 Tax=Pseudidiomarina andamanensis TaxID=1940690 RepID=A0AA92ET11_9GAMM|nr:DUF1249 domain-containing protein [Pseudidiomarina andamanensis]MDS0218768.1 DUF1249 domain-containing protein [Pseudidiomarina andamanensis]QGT95621.1 DUF1249 domain-containing protein [Pseudidiomarina andamanensis]